MGEVEISTLIPSLTDGDMVATLDALSLVGARSAIGVAKRQYHCW
jgi:hypothetical protein